MKRAARLRSQFFFNFLFLLFLSALVALITVGMLDFADHLLSDDLIRNRYTAKTLMRDDPFSIDADVVIANGGGVQVVDDSLAVLRTEGINRLGEGRIDRSAFTAFLTESKAKGRLYHYSIAYNETAGFWLIVTFPTSLRIDFAVVANAADVSGDADRVYGMLASVLALYVFLMLGVTYLYSRWASARLAKPLRQLAERARDMRDGDYAVRMTPGGNRELADLAEMFNQMAERIQDETLRRNRVEANRRRLIGDLSHDLKNPLAGVLGYAGLLRAGTLSDRERIDYATIVEQNAERAHELLRDLSALSDLENEEHPMEPETLDFAEHLRKEMGRYVLLLEKEGFEARFSIPETEIKASIDPRLFGRVWYNLVHNAIKHNPDGTRIEVSLTLEPEWIRVDFADAGRGIEPSVLARFQTDSAYDRRAPMTGLGLSIARSIVVRHEGRFDVSSELGRGTRFTLRLPRIGPI